MIAWRSPSEARPPSIATFAGIGYGPLSLSSAYSKETPLFFCLAETTVTGMPIGPPSQRPEPKSACSPRSRPIEEMTASEFAATGSASTRWFHGFDAGKTEHFGAPGSGAAEDTPARTASSEASASGTARRRTVTGLASPPAGATLVRVGLGPGALFAGANSRLVGA